MRLSIYEETVLQKRTENEQRINWSRSSLCRPGACRNLWCKLPDRIELGPTRRDWYCKNMQDLSHYRRNDSRPPESVVYAVLTSLSCFCSETKFRNSLRSCSTPSFIYLPNLSFINKYISLRIYYLFSLSTSFCLCSLIWFKNLLQSRLIISSMREVMFCISEIRHSI